MEMECLDSGSPYALVLIAFSRIPISHYLLAFAIIALVSLYNFLEFHFFQDVFSGFRGCPIGLTYSPSSPIYNGVVSKCKVLHGRYLATPWLSSPHLQTCILNFFGRPPVFSYRRDGIRDGVSKVLSIMSIRQLFHASDGGTIALDWLMKSDVTAGARHMHSSISKDDTTPIVIVIPGLTSDSASAYLKHLAFHTAKSGWNVVVSNHRGLGGVSITSDCFYNAGWTEDLRVVIGHLHNEYPKAPLFAVGTSIGANILVKYLGEEEDMTPLAGAVAVCNPWDLLIGDRFICRRLVQRLYDRALAIGLQGYAQLHEPRYCQLANWEGITKSRSIRDFDSHATCLVGKFETVDTYYRRCSSSYYVGNVSVPLLCISALDDPLCTAEAIPWDECRANPNIVLATSEHGGHLAFFEGFPGANLWWVRAINEYLRVLHSSHYMHVEKKQQNPCKHSLGKSSIDQGPYLNVVEDGLVAPVSSEHMEATTVEDIKVSQKLQQESSNNTIPGPEQAEHHTEGTSSCDTENAQTSEQTANFQDIKGPLERHLSRISRQNRTSIRLLAFIAIITSWPFLESALSFFIGKKLRSALPATVFRR